VNNPADAVGASPLIRSVALGVKVCGNVFVPFVWLAVVITGVPLTWEANPTNPTAPNNNKARFDKDMESPAYG
jgi:hypothetical protein